MKKLVTDNPKGNVESAHNLYYIKNKETWVLGGGPAPDYADISLYDFMRRIISIHGLNIQTDDNDAMGEQLYELLFDNVDSKEGVAALLYASAWAFSELREKLKAYENTGLEPEEIEALKAELQKEKNKVPPCFHTCGEADHKNHKCAGIEMAGNDMEGCIECKHLYLNMEANEKGSCKEL